MALPARLQYVSQQKQTGEAKAVLKVRIGPTAFALSQKLRQPKQPVAPGVAGLPRHRAAGFRRHVNQIGGFAGRGAAFQVEPEAEVRKHRQLELDEMSRRQFELAMLTDLGFGL